MKWIVCGGGLRCGSTLQYNLIGSYVEYVFLGRRCGYGGVNWIIQQNSDMAEGPLIGVVKTHPFDGWDHLISNGSAVGITTSRDEAGIRASMIAKFGDDNIYEESEWYRKAWASVAVVCQDYDNLVQDPAGQLIDLCTKLDLPIYQDEVDKAVETSDRRALQVIAASLPPGDWDRLTLVHHNHFMEQR